MTKPLLAPAVAPRVSPSALPALSALATVVLWAGAFPAIAVGLRAVDPVPLAAARFAVAGAAMGVWLAWRRPPWPSPKELVRVFVCALLGIALYNALLNAGQRTVSPGAASFLIGAQPLFAAFLAGLLLNERLRARAWLGAAVGFAGVALVAVSQPGGLRFGAGAALVLAAAAGSAAFFVLQRPIVARHGAATSAAWTVAAGALLLAPWAPAGFAQAAGSPSAVAAVLFLGLLPGALGYVTWMAALNGLGAARAANFLYLMAPLATALSIPLTGRLPDGPTLIGGAVALAGVALVNTAGPKTAAPNGVGEKRAKRWSG